MKSNKFYLKNIYFSLIASSILVMSCQKLDETPISFVSPGEFYKSQAQIEAAFASSMYKLWSYWGGYGYSGQNCFNNDDQRYGGNLVIANNFGKILWKAHYAALLNINSAIGGMKKGNLQGVPPATVDLLMGQAKFLRAYNYFMLVRMFGDLPLLTEDIPDPAVAKIGRSPIADVYKLIVSDFTEAIAKLPATWPTAQRGRPTRDAAKGLLAKVYLTMATAPLNDVSNYAKAADLAKQVIQSGVYSLVPDIANVFSTATKYGPEMMWSFNSNYQAINTDAQIWRPASLGGWGDFSVQPEWEQQYPEGPRKDAYILTSANGNYYTSPAYGYPNRPTVKKFMYDTPQDFKTYSSIMNMPILRFADVLLIFAEADNMANGGPTQAAVDAINKVIDRANGYKNNTLHPELTTNMSKGNFDTAVIEERNQELCFEMDRWFDLVRKRILFQKSIPSIQQNFTDDDYLFPIPDDDIQLNPLIKQNPGYVVVK
ncbi:MAG: RagB/SusD family nutrient uptake outer membrane protein [Bacteroidetes bacterium]|nr:RagB/SusD family nutrient uptake outer membrane protein [Bacteroidota bacterium]